LRISFATSTVSCKLEHDSVTLQHGGVAANDVVGDAHFAAYSFVDRITEFESGRHAKAVFYIPSALRRFSSALVAEAVGQLAAWAAMDHIEFRGRPVAALATETRFFADAYPGSTLTLQADLFACDDDAVAYNGHAFVDSTKVIELVDCLGPMLPVADFDSPDAMRDRLALLRSRGAAPGRFHGIAPMSVEIAQRTTGEEMTAMLDVPATAPFFADHFPRRPVFPATLLLDTQMRLAIDLASDSPMMAGAAPHAVRMTHVKMRSFITPGQRLAIGVALRGGEHNMVTAMLSAKANDKTVASARLELARAPGAPTTSAPTEMRA
jgi:3-hydroxymyristoyl/3-hydroxydecanoyl-(acyl carrier protein) dehydratase